MRRLFLAAALSLAIAGPALAAGPVPYTQAAFDAAQAQNKPVIVQIHATWCPTCAKQEPILAKLLADPANKDVTLMRVDFDKEKDIVRAFGATTQSTLIAFHGKTETGRSVGVTDEAAIHTLVDKTKG